jgi:hypothetical protein
LDLPNRFSASKRAVEGEGRKVKAERWRKEGKKEGR